MVRPRDDGSSGGSKGRPWVRWWIPLVLLVPGSLYVLALPPRSVAESRLQDFPKIFLDMQSKDLTASQMVLEDLSPADILLRSYTRPTGEPIWLVIIFFENARWGAHDPRLCYVSQGFEVGEDRTETVPAQDGATMDVSSFIARLGERSESVLSWWYVPGTGATSDQKTFRRLLMLEGMRRNASYGAFVRISTPAERSGGELDILKRFAGAVARQLPDLIREG